MFTRIFSFKVMPKWRIGFSLALSALLIVLFMIPQTQVFAKGEQKPIYNETLNFKVTWKGVTIGRVDMKAKSRKGSGKVAVLAKIASFKAIQGIYYVSGSFGAIWNYVTQKPVYAYEEMYQGDTYQKRSYRFSPSGDVKIRKKEQTFSEHGYPHTGPLKKDMDKTYNQHSPNYQDLMGALYYVRSTGEVPKVGELRKTPILPAGSEKVLLLKVLEKKVVDVPALGKKMEIFHVKTALKDADSDKESAGGDIFLNTTSEFHMYITANDDFIPVLIWTSLPVIGRVYLKLDNYKQ